MLRQSVALLLLASFSLCPQIHASDTFTPALKQSELSDPAKVITWLEENAEKADKSRAAEFFELGLKMRAERRWGPAGKAFGGSALFYPSPRAILEYARIKLINLGEVRREEGTLLSRAASDLRSAEKLYRSALAADSVLHSMDASVRHQASMDALCIATYQRTRKAVASCQPLILYGLISE